MNKLFLITALCTFASSVFAQKTFTSGSYTSSDGNMTITINKNAGGNLEMVEPNKTSTYVRQPDGSYKYVSSRGIDYRVAVINSTSVKTYHAGSPETGTVFSFSGAMNEAATAQDFVDYKKIAEKYKQKMVTDSRDAQMYSFCAAAAMARATYNTEGFEGYAKKMAATLKQIVIDKTKCPCEDAIPATIWNAVE